MKIFCDPLSTNTRKVLTTLAETSTPYELVHLHFSRAEHKQPSHLSRQPFGQMPALEDDGFVLYESQAMCRYINDKAGGTLMPADLRGRALVDQWMSIESANFSAHAMKFVYHHLLEHVQEPSVLEHARVGFDKALGIMATQLLKEPFIAGPTFSLADICYMPYLDYVLKTPAKEIATKHASVIAWWEKIRDRPSWHKVTSLA